MEPTREQGLPRSAFDSERRSLDAEWNPLLWDLRPANRCTFAWRAIDVLSGANEQATRLHCRPGRSIDIQT
jgi:hypothetical protein